MVDSNALASITLLAEAAKPSGALRVVTAAGDMFTGDLVGSDEDTLHFTGEPFGRIQVDRDAIHSLTRREHPNLIFDGSRMVDWDVALPGPVKDSTYRVYAGDWGQSDDEGFPDFSRLSPVEMGTVPAGYIDVDLPGFKERFAIVFDGQIQIRKAGEYQFGIAADEKARLYVDGKQVAQAEASNLALGEFEADAGGRGRAKLKLGSGFHRLRVEYHDTGGNTMLNLWMSGPDWSYLSLDGVRKDPGWRRGPGGCAQSTPKEGRLFRRVEMPERCEVDFEFTSSSSPRFVLAFGGDAWDVPSETSLRVETRDNELAIAQDGVFEPIMTLEEDRRTVCLRLVLDRDNNELHVRDSKGHALATVKGIQVPIDESTIHVLNRGEDLTIRRFRVYRRSHEVASQVVDSGKARVQLIDGQMLYGRLTVAGRGTHVVAQDGRRRSVDLDRIDHIVNPGAVWAVTGQAAEVVYADGAILRGEIEQVNLDRVLLRTAFSDAPVACPLTGVSSLRFAQPAVGETSLSRKSDRLVYASGQMHGRLSFDLTESPLSWRPEGGIQSVRVVDTDGTRIERNRRTVAKATPFDERAFPSAMHLRSGEIIPCQVLSYDKDRVGFRSPYLEQRMINTGHVKAIELMPAIRRGPTGAFSRETRDWLRDILGVESKTSLAVESVKLKHALTVPRFRRENPSVHLLVARNGDLKRGTVFGMDAEAIQFESGLRRQTLPLDRLACVVNISPPEGQRNERFAATTDSHGEVRVNLAEGSILIFTPLEFRDGALIGRSSIYGELAIPADRIQDVYIGDLDKALPRSVFEGWVMRSAREPAFGGQSRFDG